MSITITRAEFLLGATHLSQLPSDGRAEIAVLGRSNVGKSSFINRLCNKKKLARESATPGRTQEFNFFDIEYKRTSGQRGVLYLVDLPGFGFARMEAAKREQLSQMTVEYIITRESLSAVCLLNDCRRDPQRDELAVLDLVKSHNRDLLIIATKCDKISRSEWQRRKSALSNLYDISVENILDAGEDRSTAPILGKMVSAKNGDSQHALGKLQNISDSLDPHCGTCKHIFLPRL
jgi:GTP-binding protein